MYFKERDLGKGRAKNSKKKLEGGNNKLNEIVFDFTSTKRW